MPADGMFAAYRIDQDFSTCRRQMLHETAEVRELAHGPNGKWSTSALMVAIRCRADEPRTDQIGRS